MQTKILKKFHRLYYALGLACNILIAYMFNFEVYPMMILIGAYLLHDMEVICKLEVVLRAFKNRMELEPENYEKVKSKWE